MNAFMPVLAAISGNSLVSLVIYLMVFGLIFWVLDWAIKAIPIPDPFGKILRVILILAAVIVIVNALLSLIGRPIW